MVKSLFNIFCELYYCLVQLIRTMLSFLFFFFFGEFSFHGEVYYSLKNATKQEFDQQNNN